MKNMNPLLCGGESSMVSNVKVSGDGQKEKIKFLFEIECFLIL